MAYRSPRSESWPEFFSDNDMNALIEVWGAEARYLSQMMMLWLAMLIGYFMEMVVMMIERP